MKTARSSRHQSASLTDSIDRLASVRSDWDSYGALPVAKSARTRAKRLAIALEELLGSRLPHPVVGPTVDGGIALVWRQARLPRVHISVSSRGMKYLVLRNDTLVEQGKLSDVETFVRDVIKPYVLG